MAWDHMISICFIYFRTTTLAHLEKAWYSLSRQDLSKVHEVIFLDNNTESSVDAIRGVLRHRPLVKPDGIPLVPRLISAKHGDPTKTHAWSVNRVCQEASGELIFLTRSDYILDFHCLQTLRWWQFNTGGEVFANWEAVRRGEPIFVSGWCRQMAYDREMRPYPELPDLETLRWRVEGPEVFLGLPGHCFSETDQDAGVWLAPRVALERAGWMNEQLSSWGYSQSCWQRVIRSVGTRCEVVPKYLFYHLPHFVPAERSFDVARREYEQFGGGL